MTTHVAYGPSSIAQAFALYWPDIAIIAILALVCSFSGDLFLIAVTAHAIAMVVRDIACLLICKDPQSRRQSTRYEFGIGKLEQAVNLAIAAMEFLLGLLLIHMLLSDLDELGSLLSPQDLSLIALATLLYTMRSIVVFIDRRRLNQILVSPIAYAAKNRMAMFVFLQILVTFAALSSNKAVAETLLTCGVLAVALVLLLSAMRQARLAVLDLVDHPLDANTDHQLQTVLGRFVPDQIVIVGVRARRAGSIPFVEITVSANPHQTLELTSHIIAELRESVLEALPGSDIVVRVRS